MHYHAYFYFVSQHANHNEIPDILKLSATLASVNFHQVIICTNLKWKSLPKNNISIIQPPNLTHLALHHLQQYRLTLETANCYSNHQASEELCLLRWHAYYDYISSLDDSILVAMIDWDTLVLQSPANILPAIQNKRNHVLIYPDVPKIDHLLYSVCPHYLIASPFVVKLYIDFYFKLLRKLRDLNKNSRCSDLATPFLLNDMRAWSSVISYLNCMSFSDSIVGEWSDLIDTKKYCYDHNIRVLREGSLSFLAKPHYIPSNKGINFTGSDELSIKYFKLDAITNKIYCYAKSDNFYRIGDEIGESSFEAKMPICLHFSGTESKYILMRYYMNTFRYISESGNCEI